MFEEPRSPHDSSRLLSGAVIIQAHFLPSNYRHGSVLIQATVIAFYTGSQFILVSGWLERTAHSNGGSYDCTGLQLSKRKKKKGGGRINGYSNLSAQVCSWLVIYFWQVNCRVALWARRQSRERACTWCIVVVYEQVTWWDWRLCMQAGASKEYYTGHIAIGLVDEQVNHGQA